MAAAGPIGVLAPPSPPGSATAIALKKISSGPVAKCTFILII